MGKEKNKMKTKKLLALLLMLSMLVSLLPLSAAAEDEIPDGFYLVGTMNGWEPSVEYLFSENPESEGEYFLITPLSSGTEFKAVWVERGVKQNYYPDPGGNYVVPDSQAGDNMKVYFRPSYFGEWNGHFYVAHTYAITLASGIENGTVTPSQTIGAENDTIRIEVEATEGYELTTLTYNGIDCKESRSFTMPAAAVVVDASFEKSEYTITKAACTHGSVGVSGDKTAATMGETITLTNTPDAGYSFAAYAVTKEGGATVEVSADGEFTMPAANVTVSATFSPNTYGITTSSSNGTITVPASGEAATGQTVSFTVTPDTGYELVPDSVSVTWSGGNIVPTPVEGETGKYSFTMPGGPVTISASFRRNVPDGYYLIGTIDSLGMDGWTITDIDQSSGAFSLNDACTASETEYVLTGLVLTAGDEFKIVRVSGNSITEWYPITGQANYVVDGSHAGERVIYFRPTGRMQDDHWYDLENQTHDYFYVAPRDQNNEDGSFYLITDPWDAAHISQSDLFIANPGLAGEYILVTDLGYASVKVAQTGLDGAITAWYPDAFGAEYPVTDAQKGVMVVYFQKTPVAAWDGRYVYITPAGWIETQVTAGEGTISAVPTHGKQFTKNGETLYYTFLGDTVTWTAAPEPGWELDTVKLVNLETEAETVLSGTGDDSFLMPQGNTDNVVTNVRVEASFKAVNYTVTVETDGNGTASAEPTSGVSGTVVTLSASPYDNYNFKEWELVAGVAEISGNMLTIGTSNVTVKAIFEAAADPSPRPSPR